MSPFFNQHGDCSFYARCLLDKLGIKSLPVNPFEVADKMGIPILEKEAADRFEGCLLNVDGEMAIVINTAVTYEARKKFTVAHEIGHAEIPHHKGQEFRCLSSAIGIALGKELEIEANDFAAELLMPSSFIEEEIENHPIGLEVIKCIAQRCETSFTSSALRYIKFCPALAILVLSESGKIKFPMLTPSMWEHFGCKIMPDLQKEQKLNSMSLAYDFFKPGTTALEMAETEDKIDLSAWFPSLDYSRFDCHEAAVTLPSQNQAVSLIWLNEKNSYYDDGDEDI